MKYEVIPNTDIVNKTANALHERGMEVFIVNNHTEALEKVKSLIPKGASVMNGASRTLEQIGFVEYLKSGKHDWNNLHESIIVEKDRAKQTILRKQATLSDYYLGSVHALAQTGEFIIASNTGSRCRILCLLLPTLYLLSV